jgi:hypothetical protein
VTDYQHPAGTSLTIWQRQRLRRAGVGTTRHRVIASEYPDELDRRLDALAAEGWQLLGPVTATRDGDGQPYLVATLTRVDIEAAP